MEKNIKIEHALWKGAGIVTQAPTLLEEWRENGREPASKWKLGAPKSVTCKPN